ncbi:MAG: hypothetical protein K2X93_21615 [Candidatus Obscuribacterales bacterium]|nr:hypothetical protein [Candidatus Obscuribacterales bacterium]
MNKLTHLFLSLLMILTVSLSTLQTADAKNHAKSWNKSCNRGYKTGWNKNCNRGYKSGWSKNNNGLTKQAWRTNKKQGNYYQKQNQFAKSRNAVSRKETNRLNNKYRKAF